MLPRKALIWWFQSVGLLGYSVSTFSVTPRHLFSFFTTSGQQKIQIWVYSLDVCSYCIFSTVSDSILHKHNRVPQPCLQMYSHTWWWTEWPDFVYLQRHLCRWRSSVHQASVSLLPQPVMESILPLDVLSIGNESEKVLWFNLLWRPLSLSFSICECFHPSTYFVILSLLFP